MESIWLDITRLGESGFLLPIGALLPIWFLVTKRFKAAIAWVLAFCIGVALVVASKLMFFGWGIGVRSVNFTGISGHTMLAASLFPVLAWLVIGPNHPRIRAAAVALAVALALAVAVSRLQLGAHSLSEVIVGFVVGVAVAVAFISIARGRPPVTVPVSLVVVALLASGLAGAGRHAPSHKLIVNVALMISGHQHAYRRDQWLAHPEDVQS